MTKNKLIEEYNSIVKMLDDGKDVFYLYLFKNSEESDKLENSIGYIKYDVFKHRHTKILDINIKDDISDIDYIQFENEMDLRFTKHLYTLEIIKNFLIENKDIFKEYNIKEMYYKLGNYFNLMKPLLKNIKEEEFILYSQEELKISNLQIEKLKLLLQEINNITKVIIDNYKFDQILIETFKTKTLSDIV